MNREGNRGENGNTYLNKSAQIAMDSLAKAALYPHIEWIPDSESQHGDPDHPPKFNQLLIKIH